jgi:DNA-binding NtrC family response regulator
LIPAITVLLVEDDFLIMEMLKEALEEGGLAIETAITAEQAIEVLEAGVADCRALITDVNLPGRLLGWDVARRGREINDELPAIYITGGSAHDWAVNGVPRSILLVKPFAPVQVATPASLNLTISAARRCASGSE